MYTLILVDYNTLGATCEYIKRCVQAFDRANLSHILIVENGTNTDALETLAKTFDSGERLEFPGVKQSVYSFSYKHCQIVYYHTGENLGYAKGNNLGTELAQKLWADPYLIFSNNDLYFEKTLNLSIAQQLFEQDPKIAVVGPQVKTPEGVQQSPRKWISAYRRLIVFIWLCALDGIVSKQMHQRLRTKYCDDLCIAAKTGPCGWVSGCFFIARADAFFQVGMFDPHTFLYGEEPILSRRLEMAGYQVWFCRELEVIHRHGQTTKSALSRRRILELDFQSIWYYYKAYTKTSPALLILAKWNFALYKCVHFVWNKVKELRAGRKNSV